ncbi:GOLD domain [Trypanosoma melophagium]|uniref:GOLD domain n=1 Tax=Trypanosoma melophagium TaxID=715481 RepID=UPI00351A6754|nr:GOLD domain [Trypanosoma melophagium]
MIFPQTHLSPSSSVFLSLSLLILLLLLCLPAVNAVSTALEVGDVFCLQEPVPPQSAITFQFQLRRHFKEGEEIDVLLTDQDGKEIKRWNNAAGGIYDVYAHDGVRLLNACFDNAKGRSSVRFVDFHFRYHVDYSTVAKVTELDPIERNVEAIAVEMRSLQELQMQLRTQQKEHRSTVEEANERLLMWSVFQVIALVGMSLFQLYFLKRFLERKSFV